MTNPTPEMRAEALDALDRLYVNVRPGYPFSVRDMEIAKAALYAGRAAESERAELAREVERIVRWFKTEPWRGDPDPADFGGHPYSSRERAIGYGSYRDPRFLPPSLKAALSEPTEREAESHAGRESGEIAVEPDLEDERDSRAIEVAPGVWGTPPDGSLSEPTEGVTGPAAPDRTSEQPGAPSRGGVSYRRDDPKWPPEPTEEE